jgi:hypothetical protein
MHRDAVTATVKTTRFAVEAPIDAQITRIGERNPAHSRRSGPTPVSRTGWLWGDHAAVAAGVLIARLHAAIPAIGSPAGSWDENSRVLLHRNGTTKLLDRLGELTPLTQQASSELDAALDEIDQPGDLTALSNGDSGANNCLVDDPGEDGRLIDFEHACWRHALLDVAALHVPGSMWMTVADPVPFGLDDTYRSVVGDALPAVQDDTRYGYELAAACAIKALEKTQRFDKLDQREPGHHSRPQLVTTIERTARTMHHWSQLPALAGWLDDLDVALRSRWPDADVDFPNDYTLREPFDPDH